MALDSRVAALCALVLLAVPGAAAAGPPGTWTKVHDADSSTTEVGLARTSNGLLNVLWSRDADNAVLNTQVSANGSNVSVPHTVFVYTGSSSTASNNLALTSAPGGGVRAFFTGLSPGHPVSERMATATSNDGITWAVHPTAVSDDRTGMGSPVYAAQGIGGTIATNGMPISIWGDSAPGAAGYHFGLSDQTADVHFGGSSATVGGPNVATDSSTGQVVIAWSDLDTGRTITQSILPAVGGRVNTPGGEAADASERVGMTGRDGPGVFIAYLRGRNQFDSKMAVWRFGAGRPFVLSPKDARYPGVTRGPGGRLWAFWALQRATYELFAARSNQGATQFGAPVKLKPPKGVGSVYSLEGEGTAQGGGLDLLALGQKDTAVANYHQRVRPGITLRAEVLGSGRVRFTTLDAGDPLATAVKFDGNTKQTGADGEVMFTADPGKRKATATRNGYHPATKRVKVK